MFIVNKTHTQLVHVYLLTSGACHVSWNVLGLAIQSAMARGVHRRKSTPQKPSKQEELQKRAFWYKHFRFYSMRR